MKLMTEMPPRISAATSAMPDWIGSSGNYQAIKDRERFLTRTLGGLEKILEFLKRPGPVIPDSMVLPFHAGLPLLGLGLLVFCSLQASASMLAVLACLLLPVLALQSLWRLKAVLALALASAFFSAILIIPALIQGSFAHAGFLLLRGVVISGWMGLGLMFLGASGLVKSMKILRIPRSMLMVMELGIRALTILAEKAADRVRALTLRSVGKSSRKFLPLAGLAGTLFLESRQFAQEQHEAMVLRGFGQESKCPSPGRRG